MSKHIIQKYPKKKFTKESSKEFDNKSDYNSNLESSDNNNDNQKEDMLSKILTRITALENENKTLKVELKNKSSVSSSRNKETSNIIKSSSNKFIQKMDRVVPKLTSKKHAESSLEQSSSEQESDSDTEAEVYEKDILHKDCKTKEDVSHEDCMTKDASHEGCKIKDDLPIPKPVNFTNLHSKLNLEKNTAFYNLVDRHTSAEVQYKNLDKKTKAGIIRKFKKDNPHFPNCIGDWALIYLMRDNIRRQNMNKRRAVKNKPVNKRRAKNNVIYAKTLGNNTEEPKIQDTYQQSEQSEEDFNSDDEARNSECEDHEKQNDDENVKSNPRRNNRNKESIEKQQIEKQQIEKQNKLPNKSSNSKSTPQPTLRRSSRKKTNVEKRPIDE
ncbi:5323_t:CDS:2, partial [Rhizophagus irregularis]